MRRALARRDAPGVVVITATQTEKVPSTQFTPPTTQSVQSLGSGFVIDRRGDILTNDHVVAGAKGVRVGFSGGSSYRRQVEITLGSPPSQGPMSGGPLPVPQLREPRNEPTSA